MAHALKDDLGTPLADRPVAGLPVIDGEADADFLSTALGRAGRPGRVDRLEADRLDGGRISANVFSLRSDAGAFVLKKFVPEPWRVKLFGTPFNEPALWWRGLTRDLPAPLSCPTIDVAYHRQRRECWMLMDDVSHGVAPRGTFDEGSFRLLLDGLARLHARYWGQTAQQAELPILTLDQHTAMFTAPCAAAGGRKVSADWVAEVLDKVFLFRTYVPVLLDVLGSADGDCYLDLCEHRGRWLAPLSRLSADRRPWRHPPGQHRRPALRQDFPVRLGFRRPGTGRSGPRLVLVPAFLVLSAQRRKVARRSRPPQALLHAAPRRGAGHARPRGIRAGLGPLLAEGVRAGRVLPRRSAGRRTFGARRCARAGAVPQGHRSREADRGRPCRLRKTADGTTGRLSMLRRVPVVTRL